MPGTVVQRDLLKSSHMSHYDHMYNPNTQARTIQDVPMALDDFLNKAPFRLLRDAAATIKAISFFASPVVAGGTLLAYLISTQIRSDAALLAIALAALIVVVGILSGFGYYITHICDPAPYEITSIEGVLVIEPVNGHHRYTNRREQVIRARRNNVRLVEHRAHWTANGSRNKYKTRSLIDGHQLFVAPLAEEDGRTPHWIYLGRPLGKGDTEVVGFEELFEDNRSPMLPYYREGGGRYKSRHLTIRVRFSAGEDPGTVDGLIWNNDRKSRQRHVVGKIGVDRKPNPLDRTIEYVAIVPRPKRYHAYGVRWKWPQLPTALGVASGATGPGTHARQPLVTMIPVFLKPGKQT